MYFTCAISEQRCLYTTVNDQQTFREVWWWGAWTHTDLHYLIGDDILISLLHHGRCIPCRSGNWSVIHVQIYCGLSGTPRVLHEIQATILEVYPHCSWQVRYSREHRCLCSLWGRQRGLWHLQLLAANRYDLQWASLLGIRVHFVQKLIGFMTVGKYIPLTCLHHTVYLTKCYEPQAILAFSEWKSTSMVCKPPRSILDFRNV